MYCITRIEQLIEAGFQQKGLKDWIHHAHYKTYRIQTHGFIKYMPIENEFIRISFTDMWDHYTIFIPYWKWNQEIESQVVDVIDKNLSKLLQREEAMLRTYQELESKIEELSGICNEAGISIYPILKEIACRSVNISLTT